MDTLEIKRWVNLTGVRIYVRELGVMIEPAKLYVERASELNEKAIRCKLKSGIGTLVDVSVAVAYQGSNTIFTPNNPTHTKGDDAVVCGIDAIMIGHTRWRYIGPRVFSRVLEDNMIPTVGKAIQYIIDQLDMYYPGELTQMDRVSLKSLIAVTFTENEIADAVVDKAALANVMKKAMGLLIKQRAVGRGRSTN